MRLHTSHARSSVALFCALCACADASARGVDAAPQADASTMAPDAATSTLDAAPSLDARSSDDDADADRLIEAGTDRESGSRALWNGLDLSEWTGDPTVWRVLDGAIVAHSEPNEVHENTFLIYQRGEFANFVLHAELWLGVGGNSGIQYRSVRVADHQLAVSGYQADAAEANFGLLYEELGRGILGETSAACAALSTETWLHYEIEARADLLVQRIEGRECVRYRESDLTRQQRGVIALQYHAPGGFEVRFRNLTLSELDNAVW